MCIHSIFLLQVKIGENLRQLSNPLSRVIGSSGVAEAVHLHVLASLVNYEEFY